MKKRLLKTGIIIICISLFLYLIGYFHNPIFVSDVDRVVLHTYSHSGQSDDVIDGTAELDRDDIYRLIALYNLSRHDSHITSEPCCDEYWFEVFFHDGSIMEICEGSQTAVIVRPVSGERYYAHSSLLLRWVETWIREYDLSK